jgi:hypothetical protein
MCPKPSADTANACACDHYICYFARSTQIPYCMTDYITGHELGHVIQYKLCSEHRRENDKFREYLRLRNATKFTDEDNSREFSYYGGHEEKEKHHGTWDTDPAEWFAEDFRYLFGVDTGEPYWGMPIDPPDEKIKEFMLSL